MAASFYLTSTGCFLFISLSSLGWGCYFHVIIIIFLFFFLKHVTVLQAHFSQSELPISDYVTDLKSVLDQSIRIIQAMIDICANSGWLSSTITCMHLLQMVMQVFLLLAKLSLSINCNMDYYLYTPF